VTRAGVEKKEFEPAAHVFGRTGKAPSSMLESTVVW
jgi:hypothetical protein